MKYIDTILTKLDAIKEPACVYAALFGSAAVQLLGGWDKLIHALLVFMAVDFFTGLIVAGVFQKSPKTKHGGLESKAGAKGIVRKFVTLLIVAIAHQMDVVMGISYIRDAVIIGFCTNEGISIAENAVRMDLPLPKFFTRALEQMAEKNDAEADKGIPQKEGAPEEKKGE